MAEGDPAALFQLRFDENLYAAQEPENVSPTCIYRIPSWLRDLDPNAYEPRVVSIGPYHHGKEQLQAMERHKHRALNRFLSINGGISLEDILAKFREPSFLEEVRNCYTEPLKPQWPDDDFLRLMVLDGCFLLELLLDDCPEKHALLSYVKMDMLVLDNQIPLLVLRKLASIIANMPTGSENVVIQVEEQVEEQIKELNITGLIWKFYGTMEDEIPADLPDDAHHVLDAYWKKGFIGTGAYDGTIGNGAYQGTIGNGAYHGWASKAAEELYYLGVRFRPKSSTTKVGSFKHVEFNRADNICVKCDRCLYSESPSSPRPAKPSDQSQSWTFSSMFRRCFLKTWLFLTCWWCVAEGKFYLPHLTINGITKPTLLNLMAFERFHRRLDETHPVTNYVLLMASLVRSEDDVQHLRKKSILLCSPGWTNESVVNLFADLTRNVVFNLEFDGTSSTNVEIDNLCKKPSHRVRSEWRRWIISVIPLNLPAHVGVHHKRKSVVN